MRSAILTDDVPQSERFRHWHDLVSRSLIPARLSTDDPHLFEGSLQILDLGGVQIARVSCSSVDTHRTEKLIRRSDPEVVQVAFPLRGHCVITQGRHEGCAGRSGMVVYPSWRPSAVRATADRTGTVQGMIAIVPRALLPRGPIGVKYESHMTVPIAGGSIGALLRDFLVQLHRSTGVLQASEAARISFAVVDLLIASLSDPHDDGGSRSPEAYRYALLAQVYGYIARNLGDPSLNPMGIALAHNISTRSLYRLFEGEGHTVAEWIRTQRLERCRRDLGDPSLRRLTVHAIAARWGIVDAARFARSFRRAYGCSPRDYRSTFMREPVTN